MDGSVTTSTGIAERIWRGVKGGTVFVAALFSMGLGCQTTKSTPGNAIIVIDGKAGLYMNPFCAFVYYKNTDDLVFTTNDQKPKGLKPHAECRDTSGLSTDGRSVSMAIIEADGLIGPLPSRWTEDGNWMW